MRQSAPLVDAIDQRGMAATYQRVTGLVPDAYFSATKIAWLLDADRELRDRAEAGEICTFLMVCSEDSYCDMLDGFTCKKRSRVGQSCTYPMWGANTCVNGAFCEEEKCVAYARLGESCSELPCDPRDSWCDSGTCAEKKYAGELCQNDSECIGGDCDYDSDDIYRCDGPCKMP